MNADDYEQRAEPHMLDIAKSISEHFELSLTDVFSIIEKNCIADYPDNLSQLTAKQIRSISTAALPSIVRQIADACAAMKHQWWIAYQNYQERYRAMTLYHHRDEGLQISAARDKAAIDPEIQTLSIHSIELRERLELLQRIQKNAEQELEVRLAFLRSSEISNINGVEQAP